MAIQLSFHSYGHGEPLVILHGLLGSSDNWHTVSKKLSAHFLVFAVDLRNHGRSPHSDSFSYETMAQDIKEFLQQHSLSSVFLLGHSMGGKTAMTFALAHPDSVRKLIVVDIAPRDYGAQHDDIFDALYSLKLEQFQNRKQIDETLARTIPSFSTRQFLVKNLSRNDEGSFTWKINLDVIHRNYGELNKAVQGGPPFTKPTLFIRGGKSPYILDEDLGDIKRLFPFSTVTTIQHAGHWVHADTPDEFTNIVLDFCSE
ncbi:MAG TPA: alpha/beta fold hydrolase [Bacteroidota bacterium]|nr:alpha/beta fold hydrolase [Bacteroidota bacterium]